MNGFVPSGKVDLLALRRIEMERRGSAAIALPLANLDEKVIEAASAAGVPAFAP
jgi:hypothetical protein